jgi:LuxR family transcriptional regulator, quorum-sensing system regulator CviR
VKSVSLSPRELEVLKWLTLGKSSWDISVILKISERTVNYHVTNIMKKLDVTSRLQAVSEALNRDIADAK